MGSDRDDHASHRRGTILRFHSFADKQPVGLSAQQQGSETREPDNGLVITMGMPQSTNDDPPEHSRTTQKTIVPWLSDDEEKVEITFLKMKKADGLTRGIRGGIGVYTPLIPHPQGASSRGG